MKINIVDFRYDPRLFTIHQKNEISYTGKLHRLLQDTHLNQVNYLKETEIISIKYRNQY